MFHLISISLIALGFMSMFVASYFYSYNKKQVAVILAVISIVCEIASYFVWTIF